MSREQRGPNEKLGTVLALAGISNAGLARRVNDLGAQRGLTLRYDKTSVARWVSKGMVPQGAAPHLIAAAIGAKLGRPVPLHEIGLADADPAPEVGLAFPRDVGEAVRSATELYRLDLAGRRAGGGGIWQSLAGSFSVSAYATPASRWLISPADASVARDSSAAEAAILGTQSAPAAQSAPSTPGAQRGASAGAAPGVPSTDGAPGAPGAPALPVQPGPDSVNDISPLRVGHSDVTKLREAAQDARRWDSKYGGGDWRSSMVPECLRVDAAPLLLGSYSDEVGRALFGAAAELTRLAGWMAFDTGQQEAAQRYYIQALRLARAAADVPLGGYVLASMSLQATYRGFADEGVDLAQAAVERNRGLATARTMSFFRLVEARAHAKASDAPAAGAALKAAESWLERSRDGDADPSWLGFYSYDRFAADAAECYRDLKAPRQVRRFTEQALSRPTEEFVRSHGLRLVVSAVAELESGNLDAACAAGTRAVEVAGRISSARTTEYVRDLLHRLEPYGDEPRVAELRERARPLLVAPA
ncbi:MULTISPECIES: sporulation protein [unclassified Streptomyces]|uniref:sporulation protein n=1 Tax=unclassified Streptomyces TaxID=2593676 RepID=UPI002DD7E6C0|nr:MULTISPECIES: sporulation protein [unclassified Streptomyces]WSF85847.1 sporulation protein [Streptomyces sp. NBC_01744]WSC37867.1 sporulation protein [Streptomyces sp. NBC_01763]WSC45991.1 sporulation protein [Streptomyces sp. NBC_01762]WSC55012.1 sporulation protein [Streptomyces sp. NBC_01761]WSJ52396.1 sporulation protein [Streptomyces sp. NBC_01318]